MAAVLLLTKFYPFGSGEAFIENEIDILAAHAEKVIIAACEVGSGVTDCRKLPENVSVIRIGAESKLKDLISAIGCFFKPSKELKEEFGFRKGLAQRLFACYFESKSQRIYRRILNKADIKEFENKELVLYSYWLFVTARVGTLLKQDLKGSIRCSFSRAHGYDLYEERNSLNYLPMRKLLLSEYDRIYPCSDDGTRYLSEKYPEYADKIKTGLLGTFDKGHNAASSDGVFRIVSCSRMESVKRIDKLVKALAVIHSKGYNIEWTHIGGGTLEKKIKKLSGKLLKNIKCVFTGNMPNTEVLEFYKKNPVDLFVNVSSSEGLPVSIMEAIGFGIPVAATNVGGTSEIVIDGENGYLIPKDFEDRQLSDIIESFVNGGVDCESLRQKARRIWERNFRANINYEGLCADIFEADKTEQRQRGVN